MLRLSSSLCLVLALGACEVSPDADPDGPGPEDSGVSIPTDSDDPDSAADSDAGDDSGDTSPVDTDEPPDGWEIQASAALGSHNPFSILVELESDHGGTFWVEYSSDGGETGSTPARGLQADDITELVVLGLLADTAYELVLVASDGGTPFHQALGTLRTSPLPVGYTGCELAHLDDLLETTRSEVFCSNGWLENDRRGQICLDRQGRPRWWAEHSGLAVPFVLQSMTGGGFATVSLMASELTLFDRASRQTEAYPPSWFEGKTRFVQSWINGHDVVRIEEGPWTGALAILMVTSDDVTGYGAVLGAGIVVFDPANETVLWDWSIHGELGDDRPIDDGDWYELGCGEDSKCLHANALVHGLDLEGRDRFWLNLNAIDAIVQVEAESDAISWRLGHGGDFALVDDLDSAHPQAVGSAAWMFGHHAPVHRRDEQGRDRFLLFDNGRPIPDSVEGRDPDTPYSRVLELAVDQPARRASVAFEWGSSDPTAEDGMFGSICGDADLLPGGQSVLFTQGDEQPFLAQVDYPGGTERWRLSCPRWHTMFRGERYGSVYDIGG